MDSCTVAELGRNASRYCGCREPFLVTVNGRANNIVLNVSGLSIDEAVDLTRVAAGTAALARLRASAVASGTGSMTDAEIDAEIEAVRSSQ